VQDDLKARLLEDTFRSTLPALLRTADRSAARFGVEYRAPFLDKGLLTFLFSLDESALLHAGRNARILRESLEGILPEKDAARSSAADGPTPEAEWFRTLAPSLREIFGSESFAGRPYFDAPSVTALF
jgi:asparagine synthase (glutamine-hydrolysing)